MASSARDLRLSALCSNRSPADRSVCQREVQLKLFVCSRNFSLPASDPLSLLQFGLHDSFVGPMTENLHVPPPLPPQVLSLLPVGMAAKWILLNVSCCAHQRAQQKYTN